MEPARSSRLSVLSALAALAIVATVGLGIAVRAEEPLSTPVVPAEDPYTHMALIRGHLADGSLDPLSEGATLYPPGMHAILASVWVYTGLELDRVFLFGPVVLGGIAVLGIGLLLWRHVGRTAAVVGALAMALAPEEIFRTTMMSPTAVDLAVLPFFLLAVLEAVRGRLGWGVASGVLAAYFIVAHPWVLAILAPVTLGLVVAWLIFARDVGPSSRQSALGAAIAIATVGAALGFAVNACYSQCGLGFHDLTLSEGQTGLDTLGNVGAVVALGSAALLVVFRRTVTGLHHRSGRFPVAVRLLLSAALGGALLAVTVPAVKAGMPEHVDLMRMFGMPILVLGTLGLLALPLRPTRAALAGAAMVAVTYPFVIHNPLDSEFWPHRTAAYFGVGLAIMVGCGADALVRAARVAAAWLAQHVPAKSTASRGASSVAAGLVAGIPLVASLFAAGSVYAATPLEYETGWYRLYPECEFDRLKQLGQEVDGDTILIVGDWRPKLVAAAYTDHPEDVWFSPDFFNDPEHREDTILGLNLDGRDVIVVVDRHMRLEHPEADTSFLRGAGWQESEPVCAGQGITGARMLVYRQEA